MKANRHPNESMDVEEERKTTKSWLLRVGKNTEGRLASRLVRGKQKTES